MNTTLVVIDTTEVFKALRLHKAGWPQLLAWSAHGIVRVAVSEVVLREADRHFCQQQDNALADVRNAASKLDHLPKDRRPDLDQLAEAINEGKIAYSKWLRTRLTKHGVEIWPLPTTTHEELLTRDLDRRKPFNPKGKGYRDALLWESLLEHAPNPPDVEEVVLVTRNTKDFADADDHLHPDLREEAEACGLPVRLVGSLSDLIEELKEYAAGELELRIEVAELDEVDIEAEVAEAVAAAARELTGRDAVAWPDDGWSAGAIEVSVPGHVEDASLVEVDPNPNSVAIEVYDRYEGETLAMHVDVDAAVLVEGFVYKSDYVVWEGDVTVLDSDWNDHMMWVQFEEGVRLRFYVTTIRGQVEEVTFDSAEPLTITGAG